MMSPSTPAVASPGFPARMAMVAGEASGDMLAALLLQGARARWPGLHSQGIGGPQMQQQGFEAWWPSDRLSVHGYSMDVLRRVGEIWQIRNQLRERLLHGERPDVFIGVDAPDFNFGLEHDLRAHGIPTVHFVCPSIWAWRPGRVETIRKSTDHVLCVFPFEPELLARHGIASTYVGHPLAAVLPMVPDRRQARQALQLPEDAEVVALLPGSRNAEVQYLAPRFLAAAHLLLQSRKNACFVLPSVPSQLQRLQQLVQQAGLERHVTVLAGQSHQALAACDATLIASGTATLEAALLKRPMVIAYAMHAFSAWLMRRKQLQPWVGLPNILCREFVVPELLQEAASPQALAAAVADWLDHPDKVLALQNRFNALHLVLRRDTATLATNAIEKVLGR